ncbi:MAG: imidazolonepropionase [Peptococcaceae bacterium]
MNKPDLLIKNIGLLATPQGSCSAAGPRQKEIRYITDAYIFVSGRDIVEIGTAEQLARGNWPREEMTVIDARGSLVTPGLVDAHTHLIFSGWRQQELPLKLQGLSYLEILQRGGGILHTVRNTRKASLEELVNDGEIRLKKMLAHGTTTCEVKSGYGLNFQDEMKSLEAVAELNELGLIDLVPTFLGAHAIPEEYQGNKEKFITLLTEEIIPAVREKGLAEFCDVFCEEGVFDLEEARLILEWGCRYGLLPKIHADEITPLGGAGLAASLKAVSADHLIQAADADLAEMARAGTIAVLLPGTSFYLGEKFARAREMVDKGIPVAVASDFNPGSSPNESLQLPMNLACLKYKLLPSEVLTAVTLNAAAALNRAASIGTLEVGKKADIVIWDAPDLEYIFYRYGTNLVKKVIKNGKVVSSN